MRIKRVSIGLTTLLVIVAISSFVTGSHATSENRHSDSDSANLPTAYFHPSVLYFKAGRTSSESTTLTNSSVEALLIQGWALTGSHQNGCLLARNTCPTTWLAAGASCTVTLSCFPTAPGFLGNLVEYDNSAVGHHQVSLQAK